MTRQNHGLTLSYQTTHNLHQAFTPQQTTKELLAQALLAFSALGGTVYLSSEEYKRSGLATSASKTEEGNRVEFSVVYRDEQLDALALYFSDSQTPNGQDEKSLQTLSGQPRISIANNCTEQERRLLVVLQERNSIVQGLHDSVTQALTFLNLQMQTLENTSASNQREQAEESVSFIKDGVWECYGDIREPLINFCIKISSKDPPGAVEPLPTRFRRQTGIPVSSRWQGNGQALNYDERLQIIFILQKGLSNIRGHACAQHASVEIANHGDFIVKIQDDSAGFN